MKRRRERKGEEERKKKILAAVMQLGKQFLISQEGRRGCSVSLHHLGLGCGGKCESRTVCHLIILLFLFIIILSEGVKH